MPRRNSNGTFATGQSGNPAGRPKRSEQEKQVIEEMCLLVPDAVSVLKKMLTSTDAPAYLRLRAAEIVLDRVLGRPMTGMELDNYESGKAMEEMLGFFQGK